MEDLLGMLCGPERRCVSTSHPTPASTDRVTMRSAQAAWHAPSLLLETTWPHLTPQAFRSHTTRHAPCRSAVIAVLSSQWASVYLLETNPSLHTEVADAFTTEPSLSCHAQVLMWALGIQLRL